MSNNGAVAIGDGIAIKWKCITAPQMPSFSTARA